MTHTVMHVLVPEPPGELGGADMHVLDLARYQQSAGLRPVVVERGSREFAERARDLGIEVLSASGLGFLPAVRFLADHIRRSNADVVHAHGYDADYWAAATRLVYRGLFRSRPLVFTQHGVVEDTAWHKCKTALDAACMRLASGVIVCAAELESRMRRWCPQGEVEYIPNGVGGLEIPPKDQARATLASRYGVPPTGALVGYIGRLSPEKRPDRVLTLIAATQAAGGQVHAAIAGSGPLRSELEQQAEALGIREAVTFTGLVHDIGTVYGALDAMALLSDTETTSRVVIEAMAAGVPVIASAVGGVPELLDHGRAGMLVARDDTAAAVTALHTVLRDPAVFREAARTRATERYGAATMGANVTKFYQALLAGHGSSRLGSMRADPV